MLDPTEEQTKFISLRETLFLISHTYNESPQAAAKRLALNLRRHSGWKELNLMTHTPVHGMIKAASLQIRLMQLIDRLAIDNKHSPVMNDDDIPF